MYSYVDPVVVTAITPYRGIVEGGSVVTLHGEGFAAQNPEDDTPVLCRFGTVTVTASVLSSSSSGVG